MAYIKTSRSRGGEYRQIVESYREDGKVKQRVLVHLPHSAQTPEHGAEVCEAEAEYWRGLEAKETREADSYSGYRFPGRRPVWARKRAQAFARRAEKYEAKARVIRSLVAQGKIQPDSPEVREERERKRAEQERRWAERSRMLREQEASLRA